MSKDKRNIEDEINFRNVIRQPIRWFGYLYPLVFVLVLVLGYFYIQNLDNMFVNEVPPGPKDTTQVQKEEKPQSGKTVPGVNVSELANPNPQMIQKGKDLYNMNCTSCHGPQGNGDGPAGGSLNPKPRNFHATAGWINGRDIKSMYKTLQEGIPNSAMASFSYLAPIDRFSIIFYIRSLAGNFPPVSQNDLQDLDKQYNLSAGQKAASQIPIKTAMEKISSEASVRVHKAYAVLEKIQAASTTDSGAVIFNRVSRNKFEAVYTLSENDKWQSDLKYFIKSLYSGINNNGFNSSVINLSTNDLQTLHGFLVRSFSGV